MKCLSGPASVCAVGASVLLVAVAHAQQAPAPKALVMTATNLMAQDARHRAVVDAPGRPATMMAGDVVQYQLTFTNVRADSVHQIQFTDPLPAGLHYVPSSARVDRADVAIEFSVDSGRTYTAAPTVDVTVAGQTVHQRAWSPAAKLVLTLIVATAPLDV